MKNSILSRAIALALFTLLSLNAFAQRTGGFREIDLDDNAGGITYLTALGGSLGINGMDVLPDPCAILDLNSTTKGLLIPRMTGAQVSALCAVPGMLAYNTTTNNFEYFNGGSWATIISTGAWGIGGNDNITTDGVDNLLGTMNTSAYYPYQLMVGGNRIVRYEINNNIIGGSPSNFIDASIASNSVIAGGLNNTINASGSFIGGGESNLATQTTTVVVGGYDNTASNYGAFVGGGGYDGVAFVGNTASGQGSVVVGGLGNIANGVGSFVGGGGIGGVGGGLIAGNQATGLISGVVGGYNNIANNNLTFVGGGANNTASGISSIVAGGVVNSAIGYRSAIPGGARLSVGDNSFGFNGENTAGLVTDPPSLITNITAFPFTAYFGNVDLWIGNTTSSAKALRFYESNASLTYAGTNYAAIKSPAALAADYTLTLPGDDGNDGQALITDGTGTLSWGNNLKNTTGAALQIGTAATANGFTVHASNLVTNNAGAAPAPANGHSVYTYTGTAYAGAATLPGVATTGKIVSVINGTGGAILVAVAGGNYTINVNRAAQFISNGTNWYPLSN